MSCSTPWPAVCLRPVTPSLGLRSPRVLPPQSSGDFLEVVGSLLSLRGYVPPQETMQEKIFTPLTVESAVDAR